MPPVPPSPLPPPPSSPPQGPETASSPLVPPPQRQVTVTPSIFKQIVESRQAISRKAESLGVSIGSNMRSRQKPMLHNRRRTNPLIWCAAIFCLIFCLLVILFGIATIIVFLVIKPRSPMFDTPAANLRAIYFDSPDQFNGDFTFVANFTNPNRKLDVRFESANLELYFFDNLIAAQALQPFRQRRGETRLISVHLVSSLVYLPQDLAIGLQRQVLSNRITYNIRATFRVRVKMGLIQYSYSLRATCLLQMTSPPLGVLISRSCRTKR